MLKRMMLWTLVLLCLLSSCTRHAFYFPANTAASVSYQKARPQQAFETSAVSPGDGDAGPALASLQGLPVENHPPLPEARALVRHLSEETSGNRKAAGAPHHRVAGEEKKSGQEKKLPEEEKKTSKLGKAGFVLSLAGLGSLLLAGALPVFFPLGLIAAVLGTVFSKIALSEIKEAPDQYRDRRRARTGLVLGIVTLVLYLVAMVAAVLVLVAFMGG